MTEKIKIYLPQETLCFELGKDKVEEIYISDPRNGYVYINITFSDGTGRSFSNVAFEETYKLQEEDTSDIPF